MNETLRLLRYNTGNDKQAFIKFKDNFDAVIFNATIVAYSGASVADLVSVYKNQYIIDPQTHIFQHSLSAIQSVNKDNKVTVKKSVSKYLDELPQNIHDILVNDRRPLTPADIGNNIDELVNKVYDFQIDYVNKYIKCKEYDKYLAFANVGPKPKLIIAPYFMLKEEYSSNEINQWMLTNHNCIKKFIEKNNSNSIIYDVAAQLVIESSLLLRDDLFDIIKSTYCIDGYKYIFIWIDNLDTFETNDDIKLSFYKLLKCLNECNLKPIMAYGGYDSIFLCNSNIQCRLYGVAQSVGYGELRPITPVGGGLPTNKYYFLPTHRRLRFNEAAEILRSKGYFSKVKSNESYAQDYYINICKCKQCREIIKKDIDNFNEYNESIPFVVKGRYGDISRNRPTTNANLIAALHFLYCKVDEWDEISKLTLEELKNKLIENYKIYSPDKLDTIKKWCDIYAR